MLDIKQIRKNPERFRKGLTNRGADATMVDQVIELDAKKESYSQKLKNCVDLRN